MRKITIEQWKIYILAIALATSMSFNLYLFIRIDMNRLSWESSEKAKRQLIEEEKIRREKESSGTNR
jgi:hypothetical protein